jgi:hypothetical protein
MRMGMRMGMGMVSRGTRGVLGGSLERFWLILSRVHGQPWHISDSSFSDICFLREVGSSISQYPQELMHRRSFCFGMFNVGGPDHRATSLLSRFAAGCSREGDDLAEQPLGLPVRLGDVPRPLGQFRSQLRGSLRGRLPGQLLVYREGDLERTARESKQSILREALRHSSRKESGACHNHSRDTGLCPTGPETTARPPNRRRLGDGHLLEAVRAVEEGTSRRSSPGSPGSRGNRGNRRSRSIGSRPSGDRTVHCRIVGRALLGVPRVKSACWESRSRHTPIAAPTESPQPSQFRSSNFLMGFPASICLAASTPFMMSDAFQLPSFRGLLHPLLLLTQHPRFAPLPMSHGPCAHLLPLRTYPFLARVSCPSDAT